MEDLIYTTVGNFTNSTNRTGSHMTKDICNLKCNVIIIISLFSVSEDHSVRGTSFFNYLNS